MEVQIGMIAKGQADKDAVVAHTLQQFRQKFLFFVAKVARMDALFEASFSPLASSGSPCPLPLTCLLPPTPLPPLFPCLLCCTLAKGKLVMTISFSPLVKWQLQPHLPSSCP